MNKDTYIENRIKLMNSIEDNSVMILFAGKPAKKTGMNSINLLQIRIFII